MKLYEILFDGQYHTIYKMDKSVLNLVKYAFRIYLVIKQLNFDKIVGTKFVVKLRCNRIEKEYVCSLVRSQDLRYVPKVESHRTLLYRCANFVNKNIKKFSPLTIKKMLNRDILKIFNEMDGYCYVD